MQSTLIIGGGAAGFFAAAQLLDQQPDHKVVILEQSNKVLQKVKVSGGGRCNVTNAVFERDQIAAYYPRGWKLMRKVLSKWDHEDTMEWFESRNVPLYSQEDNRVFPQSDRSQSIIDCLTGQVKKYGGTLVLSSKVNDLQHNGEQWTVRTSANTEYVARNIILASGSSNFIYDLLASKGVQIIAPMPSLFTFNIKDDLLHGLEGISVQQSIVKIIGSKFQSDGPLLITHWGLSGPAVLKLSSWAARDLCERNYDFKTSVNWTGLAIVDAAHHLSEFIRISGTKKLSNSIPFSIPKRLWFSLLDAASLSSDKRWSEVGKKQTNILLERLTNTIFEVNGKSTFKEEFVTCGGVALKEIDPKTMEHRQLKGLFFAGEVLNIDAITGGYNFQAAWTTAKVAADGILSKS